MPALILSFCIPTYNRWSLLEQTLGSILLAAKRLPSNVAYEIIVSDNASSDETVNCLNHFPEEVGVRYFKRKTTSHPAENLLFACNHAKGEFIWLLGDDDPMFEDAPARIIDLIQTNLLDYIFVPRVLVNYDLSLHTCGLQPTSAAEGTRFFATGQELFADIETEFPSLVGFYGCNVIRRSLWNTSVLSLAPKLNDLYEDGLGHVRVILDAIHNRPCAMMDLPGVHCRLNPSVFHSDSRLWLDNGIMLMREAQTMGYSSSVVENEIKIIFHAHSPMFVQNKANGSRKGNLFDLSEILGCREFVDENFFWVRLSQWPSSFIRIVLMTRKTWFRAIRCVNKLLLIEVKK